MFVRSTWVAVAVLLVLVTAQLRQVTRLELEGPGVTVGPRAAAELGAALTDVESELGRTTAGTRRLRRLVDSLTSSIAAREQAWLADRWTIALSLIAIGSLALVGVRHRRRRRSRRAPRPEPLQAADALQRKVEYLATLSHEIRTPITSILGYTDLLCAEDPPTTEQVEYLEAIRRNGDHLLAIVGDVLDLSRIDAGRMRVELEEAELPGLVRDAVAMVRGMADEQGLELVVRADGPVPDRIETDPARLRQALVGMLTGAIECAGGGTIELTARVSGTLLELVVVDAGPGLAPDELAQLLEPWMQSATPMSVPRTGSGLGLALSSRLARMLGGTLAVTSEVDAGSTFTLTVPRGRAADVSMLAGRDAFERSRTALPARPEIHLAGVVVVVDDGADTRRVIAHFLRQAGCSVITAADLDEALTATSQCYAEGGCIDLVMMDCDMFAFDGADAMRRLRSAGFQGPAVGLTAYDPVEHGRVAPRVEWAEVLRKPLTRAAVLAAAARRLPGGSASDEASDAPASTLAATPKLDTLTRMFVLVLDERVGELEAALAAERTDRVVRLAERLKGRAESYGLVDVSDAAAALEAAVESGRDVRRYLERLRSKCVQARAVFPPRAGRRSD